QRLERATPILGEHDVGLARFEHFDVATERDERDAILRLATAQLQDLGTEAETKGQHLHAKCLGEKEMTQLVNENQRADEDDEVKKFHPRRARSLPCVQALSKMTQSSTKRAEVSRVTLHQLMLPEHSNGFGNVHGGLIMRMVDEAGAICAMRHAQRPCVTVAIDSITFREPVHVGSLLICEAHVSYVGRSSIETAVHVRAEDPISGQVTHTNSAFVVYVALGPDGRPCEVPRLSIETEEERVTFEE